jgi:hypothetical protein
VTYVRLLRCLTGCHLKWTRSHWRPHAITKAVQCAAERDGLSDARDPGEAQFVKNDQLDPEQGFDDLADGVVGQTPVEGFDEVGGSEVADLVPGVDDGDPEPDQSVRLARGSGFTRNQRVSLQPEATSARVRQRAQCRSRTMSRA